MRELRRRDIALAGALAAGLLLVLAATVMRAPDGGGAAGGGLGGMEISLAVAVGGGTAGATQVAAEAAETAEPPAETAAQVPPMPVRQEQATVPAELDDAEQVASGLPPVTATEQTPEPQIEQSAEPHSPAEMLPPEQVPAETVQGDAVAVETVQADPVPVESRPVETVSARAEPDSAEETQEAGREILEAEEPLAAVAASNLATEATEELDGRSSSAPVPRPKPPVPARDAEPEEQPVAAPPQVAKQANPPDEPSPQAMPAPEAAPFAQFGELDGWSQATLPSEGGSADSPGRASRGAGAASAGGAPGGDAAPGPAGSSADRRDFMAEVAAWLNRHKRYPRRARLRGDEGTGVLHFAMNRQGRVLTARIDRSSGSDELDEAILEMIHRAEPLPDIPPELGASTLEFSVPITFALR